MKKLSVSIESEHIDLLDNRQEDDDTSSRSEALRQILDEYDQLRTEYEELHTEYEELQERLESREERIEQLEEQLARRSQVEEKVDTLAKRVDETDSNAPFFVRWYQWFKNRD